MARFTKENLERARLSISLYPEKRSAMIPLLHLVQEQDGYLTRDGMEHVAELLELTPAEVYGTASFYDMFFTHPVGKYLVSVCTNIACMLDGAYELLDHAEQKLGVSSGATSEDGMFTLEEVECIALCGNAPCLTVNWRFFGDVTLEAFDAVVDDLRAGRLEETVPAHGTLSRIRRDFGLRAAAARQAPPAETGAASTSDAPQPVAPGTVNEPATGASTATSAKQVAEVKEPGDTAGEKGSGERQ